MDKAAGRKGVAAIGLISIGGLGLGLLQAERLAGAPDVVGAGGLGQQAGVADAVEASRQHMDEEAADGACDRRDYSAASAATSGGYSVTVPASLSTIIIRSK